jgi:hypothetical protein
MFMRGTSVHTPDGRRPIEALCLGDSVLVRPDDGSGETVFREVQAIVRTEGCVIRHIRTLSEDPTTRYFYAASRDQLFRTAVKGWVRSDKLRDGHRLVRADGSRGQVSSQHPVYRTKTPGVGWVQMLSRLAGSSGSLFDYENCLPVPRDDEGDGYHPAEISSSRDRFLKVTTYGLRVHEHNNFHIGSEGCWVRGEGGT